MTGSKLPLHNTQPMAGQGPSVANPGKSPTVSRMSTNEGDVSRTVSLETCYTEESDVCASLPCFDRQITAGSVPSSHLRYADPSQTMIIFDWDDTLFPSTELFDRLRLPEPKECAEPPSLPAQLKRDLQVWADALYDYLNQACALSDRCVIVTNSRRPWVTDCIEAYAPCLKPIFSRPHGAPKVIYAGESLKSTKKHRGQCTNLRPVLHRDLDMYKTEYEFDEELTMAKYAAVKQEAHAFYSQYPGQSWKNILSLGDMSYERDAVHELTFRRTPLGKEQVRTKTLILPTAPSLSEIALRMQFSRLMLPAYVRFDGDFDLDLREARDPLEEIGKALRMPQLAELPLSRHAWGLVPPPTQEEEEEVAEALAEVALAVHTSMYD